MNDDCQYQPGHEFDGLENRKNRASEVSSAGLLSIPPAVEKWLRSEMECCQYWHECGEGSMSNPKEDMPVIRDWIAKMLSDNSELDDGAQRS